MPDRNDLNATYSRLSSLFRSAWTFHQFVQGVNKIFSSEQIDLSGLSFQGVYSKLKAVPPALQSDDTQAAARSLEAAEEDLSRLLDRLVQIDERVSPALLRRFFERVKKYDRKILGQLLRFLVLTRDRSWGIDRHDKVDFLATRYTVERDETIGGDADVLAELWDEVRSDFPDLASVEERVKDAVSEMASQREAMSSLSSLEQFNEMGLIQGFRDVKHRLGLLVFEPRVMAQLVETNLFLKKSVSGFYQMEERRIASEYQEVFELEREVRTVDDALDSELAEFRGQVEALERSIEDQNVKLHSLVDVGSKARRLIPRLRSAGNGSQDGAEDAAEQRSGSRQPVEDTAEMAATELPTNQRPTEMWREGIDEDRPQGALRIRTAYAELLGDSLRQLLQMLEGSDWKADPQAVTLTEEARPFRLEAREVLAYRRLHGSMRFDREVEQFILEACALRLLISSQAEEIVGLLDVQRRRREGAPFEEARRMCRLSSLFEARFEHFLHQSLLSNRPDDARELYRLRMRLVRDYSGLWLLVHHTA
ncbi:MAG: hypothetical protein DWQ36_17905 [Acidobacteria bacterium]|nr:MAG: hypothetical protein DWQ30_15645 [Acidobacteriota bacterium]REK04311.1 MAG: hypothetical protein DWQ36_17905 [Acidobacteriota bacterium]